MTELTTKDQAVINKLPLNYQEFVKCRLEPPVKNLSQNELKRGIADILSQASFDMGSPMANDAQVLKFQTEACFNELSGKFGTLTLSEVRSAFKKGIRGEFGPYFGMCPKSYHQFIKSYFELPDRGKAQIEYLKLIEESEKPAEISEEMKRMLSVNGVLDRFKTYKETGNLGWMPFSAYNIINEIKGTEYEHPEKGKIKTLIQDKAVRLSLYNEAKNEYKKEMESGIGKAKFKRNNDLVSKLEFMLSDMVNQPTFEQALKKKYLKYYFDDLIKNNKNLEL